MRVRRTRAKPQNGKRIVQRRLRFQYLKAAAAARLNALDSKKEAAFVSYFVLYYRS